MATAVYQSFDDDEEGDDWGPLKRKRPEKIYQPHKKRRSPAPPSSSQQSSSSRSDRRENEHKRKRFKEVRLRSKRPLKKHRVSCVFDEHWVDDETPDDIYPPPPPPPPPPLKNKDKVNDDEEEEEEEESENIVHSFLPYLRGLEARYDEEFRRKRPSYENVPQIHEYYLESGRKRWLTHSTGDERLANLRQALKRLDTLGWMRSNHQREFHEMFIAACLPQLYGKDLDRCLMRILEENDLDAIHSEVMVVCPRRWGKTVSVALFLAAYLYTQPDADVCVYSIARRTSTMLVLKVYKMVVALAGGTHIIRRSNQETLEVVNMYGSTSKCNSYPAASKIRCAPPPLLSVFPPLLLCDVLWW